MTKRKKPLQTPKMVQLNNIRASMHKGIDVALDNGMAVLVGIKRGGWGYRYYGNRNSIKSLLRKLNKEFFPEYYENERRKK